MKHICQTVLSIAPHIKEAISNHLPVVALESTIISHGMQYPQNKQCAFSIQAQVKKFGAIPATIAIIDGMIKVGLSHQQIERLAFEGTKATKVSRRDLPLVLMSKSLGATTVSSTMIGAEFAGIDIFITGGIGGVHREYSQTMDVSADLRELGRTPVTVVSAGIKSILDIPKTLEYLETEGVPVITYRAEQFPAFFSVSSGIKSPSSLYSTLEIAKVLFEKQKVALKNGVLIAVPNNNPVEGETIERAIKQALNQAEKQKIKGSEMTPFLLKRVNELTQGKSLKSNISLVHNNAEIGAKIALDLARLKQESRIKYPLSKAQLMGLDRKQKLENRSNFQPSLNLSACKLSLQRSSTDRITLNQLQDSKQKQKFSKKIHSKGKAIIIGSSAIDICYRPLKGQKFQLYKSCQGYSKRFFGGIARNIAQVCARLQTQTALVTPLGNDQYSESIINSCKKLEINVWPIASQGYSTASYLTIMDGQNDEMIGISQMQINSQLSFENIYSSYFNKNELNPQEDIVIVDANVGQNQNKFEDLRKLLGFLNQMGYFVIYECKGKKTIKISDPSLLKYVSLLRMNKTENQELFKILKTNISNSHLNQDKFLSSVIGSEKPSSQNSFSFTPVRSLITNKSQQIKLLHEDGKVEMVPVKKCEKIVKSTGAGDTLTGTLASMLLKGHSFHDGLKYAILASRLSLQTANSQSVVSEKISMQTLEEMLKNQH